MLRWLLHWFCFVTFVLMSRWLFLILVMLLFMLPFAPAPWCGGVDGCFYVCVCVSTPTCVCVSDCGEWKRAAAPERVRGCPHGPIGSWHWARIRSGDGHPRWGRPWPSPNYSVTCSARLRPSERTTTQAGDGASCSDGSRERAEWEVVQRWAMVWLLLSCQRSHNGSNLQLYRYVSKTFRL